MSMWKRLKGWWSVLRRVLTPINTLCRECGHLYTYIDLTYDGSTLVEACPNCGSKGTCHELECSG
jgi:hypothetical protein